MLSYFGRDYVELGNYLEQLFPFMGVRFISVNDNYDSAELAEGATGGLDVAFKNLIYDYYSREMSKKQKIAWQRMAQQGQYNSTCALYGYKKSEKDKHKLIIEPEEAAVVREIFSMKNAGIGTTMIAKTLNDRGIPSPSELYRSRGSARQWKNKDRKCYWTACKVEDIIRDEKYTGTMVQLKTKLDSVGGKQVKRPQEESVSDRINAIVKSMEAAQKGWFALYDKYADGKLEREFFLNEKKKYDADMERMEDELAALKQTQEAEENVQDGFKRKAEQAMVFLEENELTEDMKEKLIEKVIVYPGNRIEIVWRYKEHVW